MLACVGGELQGELRVGKDDADRSGLSANLGLLKNVPSLLVHQTVEGRTRQLVEGEFAGGITHGFPPCWRGPWRGRRGRTPPRPEPRRRGRGSPRKSAKAPWPESWRVRRRSRWGSARAGRAAGERSGRQAGGTA